MKKFFIFLILLILIVAAAAFFWNWRDNIYSKEVLRLELLGPSEVTIGQEVEYVVRYKNNGDFRLDDPRLVFEPPEEALRDNQIFKRQTMEAEDLGGAIYPGEERTFSFRMRIMGKEGDVKIAKASLTYQPKDLKAEYRSSSSFTTRIKSSPLTFEFDVPSRVAPGKDFLFKINYFSNLSYTLTDLRCQVEYPSGFEFVKSQPQSIGGTEWEIPVINKSEGGRIEITGQLSGEIGEARIFNARLGIWKDGEFILLKEVTRGVQIVKPLLYLRQEINGNPQYTALPGDWLHYQVYFKNIGEEDLTNLFMVNNLQGEAFDLQTIKSDLGEYQSGDNSIVFDWRKVSSLQYLAPLEEGEVEFWVRLKEDLGNVKNPQLRNKVFIGQMEKEFITKISSKIEITQRGYFQDEVFGNSGTLPPEPGKPTTYTIMWYVKNYYSDVKNAKVRAVLPDNVELTGEIFPEEEVSKFTFDSDSREIVWSLGDIERGLGVSKSGLTLAFQIEFTPDSSQKGSSPVLIDQVKIEGEDSWTQTIIEDTDSSIDISLPDDPTLKDEERRVRD